MTYLLEATLLTAHPETQLLVLRADDGRLGGDHGAVGVVQQDGEGILVGGGVDGAGGADEAGHARGETEEVHGLVEEVGAEVVDGGAAGDDLVLPGVGVGRGLLGAVAVEVCFELGDAAEGAVLNELGEGDEVGVEATVCGYALGCMYGTGDWETYSGTRRAACCSSLR